MTALTARARPDAATLLIIPLAGAAAASATAMQLYLPGRIGLGTVGFAIGVVCFALWPWALLPTGILGGTVAAALIGDGSVQQTVAVHLAFLVMGVGGVTIRWSLNASATRRARTPADVPMALLAAVAVLGTLVGLLVGHSFDTVPVAAYQLLVIPVYFFCATLTLARACDRRNAAVLYLVMAGALTLATITSPGRHGGLTSLLAFVPLLVLAGRSTGWACVGWSSLGTLFAADLVLASYRAVWLTAAVVLLVMVVFGGRLVRRGVIVTVGSSIVLLAALASGAVDDRWASVSKFVVGTAGYRLAESTIGWHTFALNPWIGAGMGESTPGVFVPDLGITDVGPVYHALYITMLTNVGVIGLAVALWAIVRLVPSGLADRNGTGIAFAALTIGFLGFAAFAAPTDGHWELGLMPALAWLCRSDSEVGAQP